MHDKPKITLIHDAKDRTYVYVNKNYAGMVIDNKHLHPRYNKGKMTVFDHTGHIPVDKISEGVALLVLNMCEVKHINTSDRLEGPSDE